jgi:hypothetical protein
MKRDIKDFVSQNHRSKYHTVNNLSGFIDANFTEAKYAAINVHRTYSHKSV